MALQVKKGIISTVSQSTTTVGRNGNYNSSHSWSFRIDGVPAKLQSGMHSSLSEGDRITAVGQMKKGTLVIYAFANETTGAYDEASITIPLIMGILMLILGIPLSIFIVGLPLVVYGGFLLYSVYIGYEARTLLRRS